MTSDSPRQLRSRAWFDNPDNVETTAIYLERYLNFGLSLDELQSGKPIIVDAGPGTDLKGLYRARTFQSDASLEKALERSSETLGSPPSELAMPGRMNAHGISVFYGANQQLVALAEVRPPVGAQVAIGRFEIVRPLRLLDLSALDGVAHETVDVHRSRLSGRAAGEIEELGDDLGDARQLALHHVQPPGRGLR